MKKIIFIILATFAFVINGNCQYHPAAGKIGSSALFKDSSIFVNWANQCKIIRGWKDIALKDSGLTTIGDSISATGKAGENGIVSLGDSGIAICSFANPIIDQNGWDFAVFENSFDDNYLELAYIEVSSDGNKFFRFPCHSLSDTITQTSAFGYTNPEKINNLAGKYRYGFGTPFDLAELHNYKDLDKQNIRFVKIVDIIGSLNSKFANYDTANRKINDPYPSLFASGGFDLDAIGVINEKTTSSVYNINKKLLITAPNPLNENYNITIKSENYEKMEITIFDYKACIYRQFELSGNTISILYNDIPHGFFIIKINGQNINHTYKGFKI